MGEIMHYKLCVMGNPIDHSKSPEIHEQFAQQFNLAVNYTKVKPDLDKFPVAVNQFIKDKGYGFNVTLPFKLEAYHLATERSDRAQIAKSVNTVLIKPDGTLFGDNTDGMGLINDIIKNLNYSLSHKKILIIGAGGAVRGILQPLLSHSPKELIIVNRTLKNAEQLAHEFKPFGNIKSGEFLNLENLNFDVVIDGTSFNSHLSFPDSLSLSENSLCYDLKYSNQPTSFMQWALSKGATQVTDGLGMLVEQAAEAFNVWTSKKPETIPVIKYLRDLYN